MDKPRTIDYSSAQLQQLGVTNAVEWMLTVRAWETTPIEDVIAAAKASPKPPRLLEPACIDMTGEGY